MGIPTPGTKAPHVDEHPFGGYVAVCRVLVSILLIPDHRIDVTSLNCIDIRLSPCVSIYPKSSVLTTPHIQARWSHSASYWRRDWACFHQRGLARRFLRICSWTKTTWCKSWSDDRPLPPPSRVITSIRIIVSYHRLVSSRQFGSSPRV